MLGEPAGRHEVVVLGGLVSCHQHGHALPNMKVQRVVDILHGGIPPLRPPSFMGLVALVVPIPKKNRILFGGIVKGNGDKGSAVDLEHTNTTRGPVESGGREVKVGSNLVLDLEAIGVVLSREDGAHSAGSAILPRILPLLDARPSEEERLVELVEDIDDDVVVRGTVDRWARELTIDKNALLGDAKRCNGAIRDLPFELESRVPCKHTSGREAEKQQGKDHLGVEHHCSAE
ncbi:UNVERIFIED_CONTAM: hypothetical protein Sradi_1222500 [Sesamum radiatum]|uniref:Uncharacterized protein n=1 Tax=Sesamum radiatum TaxID=300843 RepID=A0AAW2UL57_SESRA